MPPGWAARPRLSDAEVVLFNDFVALAQFCGGPPSPQDTLAWFEIQGVPPAERGWMSALYGAMCPVLRERQGGDE